jgi:urease accessory protein
MIAEINSVLIWQKPEHYNIEVKMMILLTTKLAKEINRPAIDRLELTAAERSKSRFPFISAAGQEVYVQLERGTVLYDGDRLQSVDGKLVMAICACPESLLVVSTDNPLKLLQAAYHLGNRHVALEMGRNHLYLQDDSVLRDMLEHRGLEVQVVVRAFDPEPGAYEHHH